MKIIAIAGPPGSGKKTLLRQLCDVYKKSQVLYESEFQRAGTLDIEILIRTILELKMKPEKSDYIFILGYYIYSSHALRQLFDFSIYVDASKNVCTRRSVDFDHADYYRNIWPSRAFVNYIFDNNIDGLEMDVAPLLDAIAAQSRPLLSTGYLYIITGPYGVGKTTIIKELVKQNEKLIKVISFTTRPKRQGEIDGLDYHFLTEHEYKERSKTSTFFANYRLFSHQYGISRAWVQQKLGEGFDLIMDASPDLALQIRNEIHFAKIIFIAPEKLEQLQQQLEKRNTDAIELHKRMQDNIKMFSDEIYRWSDYVIFNNPDQLPTPIQDINAIMTANRFRLAKNRDALSALTLQARNTTVVSQRYGY